jgi:hypothetical protein
MNDGDLQVEVVVQGHKFTAARWMVKQVMEFQGMVQTMTACGCTFDIFPSDGLLPLVCRLSNDSAARANQIGA